MCVHIFLLSSQVFLVASDVIFLYNGKGVFIYCMAFLSLPPPPTHTHTHRLLLHTMYALTLHTPSHSILLLFHYSTHTPPNSTIPCCDSPTGDWNMTEPGVTAIAHPSPLQLCTNHGVFVLNHIEQVWKKDDKGKIQAHH